MFALQLNLKIDYSTALRSTCHSITLRPRRLGTRNCPRGKTQCTSSPPKNNNTFPSSRMGLGDGEISSHCSQHHLPWRLTACTFTHPRKWPRSQTFRLDKFSVYKIGCQQRKKYPAEVEYRSADSRSAGHWRKGTRSPILIIRSRLLTERHFPRVQSLRNYTPIYCIL